MKSQKLLFARAYEKEAEKKISRLSRPRFHLSPRIGWMNDPNGFSYYKGQYHLFYQYHPYNTEWGPMHWGHAVSSDLLHWKYLPAVMAPDEPYDSFGCFSGSAVELPNGLQLLLYTGVRSEGGESDRVIQCQCAAIGDGKEYRKYAQNPVIHESMLPFGMSKNDFRDPKIWREPDGSFWCVVGSCDQNKLGRLLLFSSRDGLDWTFESVLAENDGRLGRMWECPDFFLLDKKHILLVSPQDMLPKGFEYHNGNGTVCMIGRYDKKEKRFVAERDQAIDYGIDFYAPQTTLAPDGRRIMIGWMQNWDTCTPAKDEKRQWFGQMSLPRELTVRDGRLFQRPVRELERFRSGKVVYQNVALQGELTLDGIEGRTIDLEIQLWPGSEGVLYRKFALRFAQNEQYRTALSFRPYESIVKLDRKFCGSRRAHIHQRRSLVNSRNGCLKLRVILDRFSVEAFVNDGEQVMSATFKTDLAAKGISFFSDGEVRMDVTKYDLFVGEE